MRAQAQARHGPGWKMTEVQDIVDTFDLLGDWDQRYQYLVELGEDMEPMPAGEKTDDTRVKPCMSTVHVSASRIAGSERLIGFHGDCDTAVIKGVVALLVDLLSGRTAQDIRDLDVDGLFKRLRLAEHLSPNRHVGIYAIVEKMKTQAAALAAGGEGAPA